MNYTELTAAIKAYSENDFPQAVGAGGLTSAEQIARFVQQAEQRIFNSIQFPALRKNVTGTCTANVQYLATPVTPDWLATYSLARINADGSQEFLLNKDVEFIREAFPYPSVKGPPTHYAVFDDNTFILGPTPDVSYSMELHYFYYPTSITTAGTSWLGNNLDTLLLYGSLLEAASFMKSDADVIKNYTDRYNEAFIMAKQLGDGKDRQDMYRTVQVRYPVK